MLSLLPTSLVSQTANIEERRAKGLHPIDELQRFRLFMLALCCSICISMIYVFDLFTKDFKDKFELSAGDMSTVSTIGLCVCWFVLPYGFLFNHYGPTPLFALAMVIGFTGSLCLGLVFNDVISGNLGTISVFYALICSASGLLDSASIITLAEVFPRNRGLIIGCAKVMTGLGSSMWASLSLSVFQNDVAAFLFFIMTLALIVSSTCLIVVRLPPYFITPWRRGRMDPAKLPELEQLKPLYHKKSVPVRRLGVAFVVIIAFIIFFTTATPLKAYTTVSYGGHIVLGTITVALFLCFFAMTLPIRWLGGVDEPAPAPAADDPALRDKKQQFIVGEPAAGVEMASLTDALPVTAQATIAEDTVAQAMRHTRQDPRYGGSLKSNLLKPDLWLILFGFAFQSAIGNMVLYNSSTISVALNGHQRSRELSALYTAFLGVGSACGRIVMGIFEAYVQHQDPENRRFLVTIALPLPPVMAVIACILLLVLPGDIVLFPYLVVYFEEGFFNAIRAIIYPCIFESHHPVYYNMSFISSIISIVCFNRILFGFTVDHQHDKLGFKHGEDCTVRECVRTPIIVACVAAALAAVMQFIVHVRYSRFVRRVRAEQRLRDEEEVAALGQVSDAVASETHTPTEADDVGLAEVEEGKKESDRSSGH